MGITKGKWGTLITELFEFKRLYDENAPLAEVFPDLTDKWPDRYGGMTLQGLVAEMHAFKKDRTGCAGCSRRRSRSSRSPPSPTRKRSGSWSRMRWSRSPSQKPANRIVATGIVPYPPGIPLLAPGERTGRQSGPVLQYLLTLQEFDKRFPGFEHDTHGIENVKRRVHDDLYKERRKRRRNDE